MVDFNKNILSQIDLHYGKVSMPKGFEINNNILTENILKQELTNSPFTFTKEWDKLNRYIVEHLTVEQDLKLINKLIIGNSYKPETVSLPICFADPLDLRNSPDYVMLYGVSTQSCFIKIYYDNFTHNKLILKNLTINKYSIDRFKPKNLSYNSVNFSLVSGLLLAPGRKPPR